MSVVRFKSVPEYEGPRNHVGGEPPLYADSCAERIHAQQPNEIQFVDSTRQTEGCALRTNTSLNGLGRAGQTLHEFKRTICPVGIAVKGATEDEIRAQKGKEIATTGRGGLRIHPVESTDPIPAGALLTYDVPNTFEPMPMPHSSMFSRPNDKKRLVVKRMSTQGLTAALREDVWTLITNPTQFNNERSITASKNSGERNAALAMMNGALLQSFMLILTCLEQGLLRPGALRNAAGEPVEAGTDAPISVQRSPIELYEYVGGAPNNASSYRARNVQTACGERDDGVCDTASVDAHIVTSRLMEAMKVIPSVQGVGDIPSGRWSANEAARTMALARMFTSFAPDMDLASRVGFMRTGKNVAMTATNRVNQASSLGRMLQMQLTASDAQLHAMSDAIVEGWKWSAGICVDGSAPGGNIYAA